MTDTSDKRKVTQEVLHALASIKNGSPAFLAKVWSERHGGPDGARDLRSVSTDRSSYRIGEDIRLCFQSERDCYLWVFDVGTSGTVRLIFPNKWCLKNQIKAHTLYTMPGPDYGFQWIVQEPTGTETIKALFLLDPQNLLQLDLGDLPPFPEVRPRDIMTVARQVQPDTSKLPSSKWAECTCEFRVTR